MATQPTRRANPRPRSGKGKFIQNAETAQRDADACRLRTRGLSFDQIAEQLGFASRGHAHNAVERALNTVRAEAAIGLLELEAERLDDLTRHAQRILQSRHLVATASGKVAVDPATGEPLRDYGPAIQAINSLRQISESRRKLYGLDKPAKFEVRNIDDTDAKLQELADEMAAMDA